MTAMVGHDGLAVDGVYSDSSERPLRQE